MGDFSGMTKHRIGSRIFVTVGFYLYWWLRTVGWVIVNGSQSNTWQATAAYVGEIGLLLLPWLFVMISLVRQRPHWIWVVSALLALTLLSSEIASGYVAPFLPALTILTGWILATAMFNLPMTPSVKHLATGLVLLTFLCFLSPQTSARLYAAGYHSPTVALRSGFEADRHDLREARIINYFPDHPQIPEVGMLEMSGYPVNNQNSLSIDVHRLGFLYFPTEDQWWVM